MNDESLGFFEGRVVRLVDIGLRGASLGMPERFRDGGQGDIFLIGMARPSVAGGVGGEGIGIVDHYRQLFQQAVLPTEAGMVLLISLLGGGGVVEDREEVFARG